MGARNFANATEASAADKLDVFDEVVFSLTERRRLDNDIMCPRRQTRGDISASFAIKAGSPASRLYDDPTRGFPPAARRARTRRKERITIGDVEAK